MNKVVQLASVGEGLLTEHEAAALRRQSVRTLQHERLHGSGCPYVKLGRSVRYRRTDVIDFIQHKVTRPHEDDVASEFEHFIDGAAPTATQLSSLLHAEQMELLFAMFELVRLNESLVASKRLEGFGFKELERAKKALHSWGVRSERDAEILRVRLAQGYY